MNGSQHKRNVLNWYARLNNMYLHPGCENATLMLISEANINEGDKVLEVGFGVGESICKLARKFNTAFFYGVEINPFMYSKTKNKIRKLGLKNVSITLINQNDKLPFSDSVFNLIYFESVLAINETKVISSLLSTAYTLLKPGGQVLINEGIWKSTIKYKEIEEINAITFRHFGIFQANSDLPYSKNWVNLFNQSGFRCKKDINLIPEIRNLTLGEKLKGITIKLIFYKGFKKLKKYSNFIEGHLFVLEKL